MLYRFGYGSEHACLLLMTGILKFCFIVDFQQTKKKESDCSRIGSQSSLPSYNEATSGIFTQNKKETKKKKKKIIPVQSDFESSSPSPEPGVLPPSLSPVPPSKTSIRMSQSSVNLARMQEAVEVRKVASEAGFDALYSRLIGPRKPWGKS